LSPRAYRLLFWVGFALLIVFALGLLQNILLPFAAGLVIAYVLAPAVNRLERFGLPRSVASLLVLILFLLGVACIFVLLVPLIEGQILQLIARMPSLVALAQDQLGKLMQLVQEQLPAEDVTRLRQLVGGKLGETVTFLASLFQSMISNSFALLNVLSLLIVTPIVTFFLLRDWEALVARLDSYVPRQSLETVREQARIVSDTLVGFVHGQALVCFILAAYYATALSVAGLSQGLALGLLIGVLAIIPFVGVTIGFTLAVALAATQYGNWSAVFIVCGIFAFGSLVESNFLTPKLVGDRIHLHPVWVIFALFAGGTLFGFVGVLLAVPAAAVIGVLIRFGLAQYQRSPVYDSRNAGPFEDLSQRP
jgi:predicted PurR-regulated permease PerM